MRLQRETDYAMRCVLYLALQSPETVCSKELAQAIVAPTAFTKKIVTKLCRARLVTVQKGRGGGASLARPAADISIYDVVRSIEGELYINQCLGPDGTCSRGGIPGCSVHVYLKELEEAIKRSMQAMTFDRVLAKNNAPQQAPVCCRPGVGQPRP